MPFKRCAVAQIMVYSYTPSIIAKRHRLENGISHRRKNENFKRQNVFQLVPDLFTGFVLPVAAIRKSKSDGGLGGGNLGSGPLLKS